MYVSEVSNKIGSPITTKAIDLIVNYRAHKTIAENTKMAFLSSVLVIQSSSTLLRHFIIAI